MRQIAGARGALMKGRFFSDQALANLAIALAGENLQEARVLAGEIQDDLQRARAYAGMAAQSSPEETAGLLEAAFQFQRELDVRQVGFVLYEAALAAAPLNQETALALAGQVAPADLRALALVEIASVAEAFNQPAGPVWEAAAAAARAAQQSSGAEEHGASLAHALAALGGRSAATAPGEAAGYWQAALEAARHEESELMRVSALTRVAEALRASDPQRARGLLEEAARLAWQLDGLHDCGGALSDIYAQLFPIDEAAAVANLAGLRSLGRVNFLDGLDAILPPAAARYGAGLAWELSQALERAEAFFPEEREMVEGDRPIL